MKKKKRPFRCLCCGVVFGNDNNIDQQYVAEGLCRSCYRGRCKNPDYQPEITYHHLSQRRFAGLCKECGKPMYYTRQAHVLHHKHLGQRTATRQRTAYKLLRSMAEEGGQTKNGRTTHAC